MTEDLDARLWRLQASEDVDALIDLGCDLAEAGRQRDAEDCFRRAADLGDPVAWFDLGNALAAQGRGEEAVDSGVTEEDALELVLGLLSPPRLMELASEAMELYVWDRAGSDN